MKSLNAPQSLAECLSLKRYLLFLSVKLETLSKCARLRLMMMLSVQIDALSIWDVLLLRVSKQTAGRTRRTVPSTAESTPSILRCFHTVESYDVWTAINICGWSTPSLNIAWGNSGCDVGRADVPDCLAGVQTAVYLV